MYRTKGAMTTLGIATWLAQEKRNRTRRMGAMLFPSLSTVAVPGESQRCWDPLPQQRISFTIEKGAKNHRSVSFALLHSIQQSALPAENRVRIVDTNFGYSHAKLGAHCRAWLSHGPIDGLQSPLLSPLFPI